MFDEEALKRARQRIESPAEAISATTAGRNAERTVCTPVNLRYL